MIDLIKNIMKLMQNDDKNIRYIEIHKSYAEVTVNHGIEDISKQLAEKITFEKYYRGLGGWLKCIYVKTGGENEYIKFMQFSEEGPDREI